jgi:thiamine pyrophosphate-dependent acetolactate synthase large subunit-like protein
MMSELKWKQPKARELLGGDLVAQSLAQLGVKVAFGLHGGHLDSFLIGCHLAGIHLIDTRHETVAVQAAEGYAKLSGNVGLCFVTANSGFSNGLPGLATAFADRSPIFVVTTSPPLRDAETNSLQGFHDQVVLAKPITKFAHRVTNVEEIPRIVSYAFRTAHSGIPGPVVVDFPIDILFMPPRMSAISYGAIMQPAASVPAPDPSMLSKLAELWTSAKRPVLVTGTGAARATSASSSKSSPLLSLAEKTKTPIFYSSKFAPNIPSSSPLRCGPASFLAFLGATKQPTPDLVILLGARTGFLLGGRGGAVIPSTATIVQIDLDGAEIGKSLPVAMGIVSDTNLFISTFLSHLSSSNPTIPSREEWIKTTSSLKNTPTQLYDSDPKMQSDGQLHPYHAIKTLFTSLPSDSLIIIDGGEAGVWALDLLEHAHPTHALVSTGYLGFLGNGYGYSLGAALACPDKLIVNIHGDGSAGFHIAELDTYARHNLNILTVVVNNYFWGMSVAGQDIIYEDTDPVRAVSALSPKCRFDIVAQGFGCKGEIVKEFEEVESATKEITKEKGAGLINLIVSRQPITKVTRGMVGKTDDRDVIVVPYYDNVPRAYYREKGEQKGNANGSTEGANGKA